MKSIPVTNSEKPSTAIKEQFESIQPGDTINGYMKNENSFITDKDFQFEKSLDIPVLIFLYLMVLTLGGGILRSTKFFKTYLGHKWIFHKAFKGLVLTLLA